MRCVGRQTKRSRGRKQNWEDGAGKRRGKKPGLRRKRKKQVEGEARGEGEPARGKRL